MILLGNIGSNIAQGALVNNEVDFINKYGKTTLSYDKLDQLGNIKSKNFFLVSPSNGMFEIILITISEAPPMP